MALCVNRIGSLIMKNTILFDLDGTLTDPGRGITNSVTYALSKFGIEENDREKLYPFIGPPLYDSFVKYYGMSHDDANLAITYYREYFAPTGIFENEVYHGVSDMLKNLRANGKTLVLATSKPEEFARSILEHFDLGKYFDFVSGATMDEKRNKKDEVIAYALSQFGIDPDDGVMVGDRKYDIEGGHKNGLTTVGVLFGYGSHSELVGAGADKIAGSVSELEEILLKKI